MYLFYKPNVVRCKLDEAVFSPTPSYKDSMEVCVLSDWLPENCLDAKKHSTKARLLEWKEAPHLNVKVPVPTMIVAAHGTSFHERLLADCSQVSEGPVLCEMTNIPKEVIESLLEYNKANNSSGISVIDLVGKSGTRNAKRLSIIAAPSLQKFAAEGKLPLSLNEWLRLPDIPNLGKCTVNNPSRPKERWELRSGESFERVYDAEESNEYYMVRDALFSINGIQSNWF
jgi:hypothetical protein